MAKIIDSFLFFQELDLLEIRLKYLYDKVDLFIILEASQTFTGKKKDFNFEKNIQRFDKYLDKIKYFKIKDFHESYESVITYLDNKNNTVYSHVKDILENHDHYPKDGLHWVLDTYHREALHIAYDKYAEDDDILLLSDLDEIPSEKLFDDKLLYETDKPVVCQQHEFMYFLNYYNNSDWLGTIFGRYNQIKKHSLNNLRIDSKKIRNVIAKETYKNGGYHFTSVGNIKQIKRKIESWAHQEFNNASIINRLEYNIRTGQDIFEREYGTVMNNVDLNDSSVFDTKMASILGEYEQLITKEKTIITSKYSLYNIYRRVAKKIANYF